MQQKELRIALVCYGGVSLAVYMHGVTKELWQLARASRAFHGEGYEPQGIEAVYHDLLKEIEADAFVFYTNYESRKGQEIAASGKAAFVLHWKSLHRQIRVRGTVTREEGEKADAYYASRSLKSRLGAWASQQSRPLGSRTELMAEVAKLTAKLGPNPARPPFWGGFRIQPTEIEFWADGAFRLHDRFRWVKSNEKITWEISRLNP